MDQNQINQQTQNQSQSPQPNNTENSSEQLNTQGQQEKNESTILSGKEGLQKAVEKVQKEEIDKKIKEVEYEGRIIESREKKNITEKIKSFVEQLGSKETPTKITASPNLLSKIPVNPVAEKHHIAVSTVAKVLVIAVQAAFVLLLGYNEKMVADVGKIENEVRALETQLISKTPTTQNIISVIEKSDRLKSLRITSSNLAAKLERTIANTPDQIAIKETHLDPFSFEISIETSTPLEASLLINSYLNNGVANQIIIKSANLSNSTGKFLTELEVIFR